MAEGRWVECTEHNGAHRGEVAYDAGAHSVKVNWADRNPQFGQPGNNLPEYPAEFVLSGHLQDLNYTDREKLRPLTD
jgi:hypothetical protein